MEFLLGYWGFSRTVRNNNNKELYIILHLWSLYPLSCLIDHDFIVRLVELFIKGLKLDYQPCVPSKGASMQSSIVAAYYTMTVTFVSITEVGPEAHPERRLPVVELI